MLLLLTLVHIVISIVPLANSRSKRVNCSVASTESHQGLSLRGQRFFLWVRLCSPGKSDCNLRLPSKRILSVDNVVEEGILEPRICCFGVHVIIRKFVGNPQGVFVSLNLRRQQFYFA